MTEYDNWTVEAHFDPNKGAPDPLVITKENENDMHVNSDEAPSIGGIVILHTENGKTWEWKIATIKKWPEFDRRTCHKEIHLPWCDRERIPYPCMWTRSCEKKAYVRLTYSGGDLNQDLEDAVKDCAKVGLAAALPLALAGQYAAAAVAFVEALKSCLIAKGVKYIGRFNAGVYTTKECGRWHRV